MPTAKQARQRSRRVATERTRRPRRVRRQAVVAVVVVAVAAGAAVGIYLGTSSGSGLPYVAGPSNRAQVRVDQLAAAAGCPDGTLAEPRKPSWGEPPPMTIDTHKLYTANFVTDVGTFSIALDATSAPKAVNNFVFLVDHGFYNCLTIYRAVPDSVFADGAVQPLDAYAESGSPTATGSGGPGYLFSEAPSGAVGGQAVAGTAVMVDMSGPGATPAYGSQFSILLGTTPSYLPTALPAGDEPFGFVSAGLDELEEIVTDGNSNSGANGLPPRVVHRIFRATISER